LVLIILLKLQRPLLMWLWWVRSIENKKFPTQEHIN
jgi:hypothetical protein